ncbi:MAG: DctP family TRAP transporter solute-binding subunit [Lachnospiraceae bacterium]|nr:DctP family TRAP transporter solute-binding subunit [Lachnospiraceae bacterium]
MRRNLKKGLSAALIAAMTLSLTACGEGAPASAGGDAAQTDSAAALNYKDYASSDKYVASADAAKYDGTDAWPDTTWNFDCSTGETSTWAQTGYYFNALMQESTGGKVKVEVYPGEQLTNGDQVAGIQALMDGSPIQVSLHSNLIYANFDARFNAVSLPYIYANYDDVDRILGGEAGDKLKEVLAEKGLKCEGIAENGFRQITNSKQPITKVDDLKNIKMRICSNDLCAEVYKEWGCDASVMNWSETYTALQQGTVDGEENPETAIASASVQDVQDYISLWNAYYDCLFFCINQAAYDKFTDSQKAVIDANAAKAVAYQKAINREQVDSLVAEWKSNGAMQVTENSEIDSESFKSTAAGAADWYKEQLVGTGMSEADAAAFIKAFTG